MSQTHSPAKLCSWQFQLEFPFGSVSPFVHPEAFSHIGCHQNSWRISQFIHTKKKTDEKQSTISKLKRLYKICSIQGKFASEECNSAGTCCKFQKRKKNEK